MSYLVQQIDGTRVGLREFRSGDLLIGRGTNAQIRSENPAVALSHAVIRKSEEGFVLSDLGSITGTYLNGSPVEKSVLRRGDELEIGDLKLVVQMADISRPLFLRLQQVDADRPAFQRRKATAEKPIAAPSAGIVSTKRIDYAAAYRLSRGLLTKAAVAVVLTLVAITAVGMVTVRKQLDVFSPGKLSAAHAGVRLPDGEHLFGPGSCGECHHPFAGPSDARCQNCHTKVYHQASKSMVGECSRCHAEHRRLANLSAVHESNCIDCHRDLRNVEGAGIILAKNTITGFELDHPELTISFPGPAAVRVTADVAIEGKMDSRGLKFDHACHMTGKCAVRAASIDNPQRVPEKLDCITCHRLDPSTGGLVPVTYEESCARCHPLTFDNRFPPVPHGVTLEAVAGVIANAYGGNRELLSKSPEEVARIFSQSSRREFDVGSATVRNAQRTLRVRCEQCHRIEGTAVRPVSVSRKWFRGMKPFNHAAHLNESLETRCETCHEAATRSSSASDVLMPTLTECSSCHRRTGTRDAALGGCLTCHFYHLGTGGSGGGSARGMELAAMSGNPRAGRRVAASPPVPADRTIANDSKTREMLMTGTFILFLFLAAAVALWIWVRRRPEVDAPRPRSDGQVSPRQPAAVPPAAPRPMPAAAAVPPPEPTVAINLPIAPSADMGGTMMIQWYGSLAGIEGPYKGRKIPIDPDGFYIGRDKEMSSIVVDDPRISRRHVWIGVKNGRVIAKEQGSTNGTFLNTIGSAPITEVELKAGDVLILADTVASFRYEP